MYALGGVEFRLMALTGDYQYKCYHLGSATAIVVRHDCKRYHKEPEYKDIRYKNIRTHIARKIKLAFEDEFKRSGALTKSLGEVTKCRKEE